MTRIYTLESGPVKVLVQGISYEELYAFFYPFFDIKYTSLDKSFCCEITVNSISRDKWNTIYNTLYQIPKRKQVLYSSNKPKHHIEGWILNKKETNLTTILLNDCCILISKLEKRVVINANQTADINPVIRVVIRDIMRREWEKIGGIMMHATAISIENEVTLIMGPKGSGKTNLMLKLLQTDVKILSFDRVIMNIENKLPVIYSWPTYFNVFQETINRFPNFFPYFVSGDEIAKQKISLVANQVQHLGLVNKGVLNRIISPNHSENIEFFKSVNKTKESTFNLLLSECISLSEQTEDWHGLVPINRKEYKKKIKESLKIISDIDNCFDWYYGND